MVFAVGVVTGAILSFERQAAALQRTRRPAGDRFARYASVASAIAISGTC